MYNGRLSISDQGLCIPNAKNANPPPWLYDATQKVQQKWYRYIISPPTKTAQLPVSSLCTLPSLAFSLLFRGGRCSQPPGALEAPAAAQATRAAAGAQRVGDAGRALRAGGHGDDGGPG